MGNTIVDIADMKISTDPNDLLVTYSLGSCIGVTVHDPTLQIGGMAHFMLPLSKVDSEKAKTRPFMFVDTGMAIFLGKMFELGVTKANAIVKVAGGSSVLDNQGIFRIGERNYTVFRKLLWKNGMMITSEDVGGNISRTLRLQIASGLATIKSKGREWEL